MTQAHLRPVSEDFPVDQAEAIRVVAGELPATVDAAEAALTAAGEQGGGVYQRGDLLVSPVIGEVPASDGSTVQTLRLAPLTDIHLRERLTRLVAFQKYDKKQKLWRAIDCPIDIARTLLARGAWRLPQLRGIVPAPTLRADGTPLEIGGYDARSLLILDTGAVAFQPLPARPDRALAVEALAVIEETLSTFPFVTPADSAVALSGLLTALVRRSLPTAPMHAITASAPGSGKSLLVDVIATIATGRRCPVATIGESAEEAEKRLGAMLIAGDAIISLDNVDHPLSGEFLCQVLSQETLSVRLLGASRMVQTPSASMFFATGNNLRLEGDVTRRSLLCHLDAGCERPEFRQFDRDAVAYAKNNRAALVYAALLIMRAHQVADRPAMATPLGGFEQWSSMVRDALLWVGAADPVTTIEAARATDPELENVRAVAIAWEGAIQNTAMTAREIIAHAAGHPSLHAALVGVAGVRGEPDSRRFGNWLGKWADRIVAGRRFVRCGEKQGVALWQLLVG